MGIKSFRPVTPSLRNTTTLTNDEITKSTPEKRKGPRPPWAGGGLLFLGGSPQEKDGEEAKKRSGTFWPRFNKQFYRYRGYLTVISATRARASLTPASRLLTSRSMQ